ncbi:MAG: AAA family ATPase [Defluviitaleaceae bacterium]|nr:AAA family ATPase [Defluviitaleaceae bacterium]
MKLLFLFGTTAVGKMTVGQEIMKITDMRLFHNHIVIEPVLEVFGEFNKRIMARLREVVLEEFAASSHYGLIITGMINFNSQDSWDYIAQIIEIFEPCGVKVYFAELVASQEVRLQRNVTENRLRHKASKRDVEASNQRLIDDDGNTAARYVSNAGEFAGKDYIKIDNTDLRADVVAKMIKERFSLFSNST